MSGAGFVLLDVFVEARATDDEVVAVAAARDARNGEKWGAVDIPYEGISVGNIWLDDAGYSETDTTRHLARYDPARVLAQCAAFRRLVTAYRDARTPMQRAEYGWALKALAAIWAEHEDYDPTWRL